MLNKKIRIIFIIISAILTTSCDFDWVPTRNGESIISFLFASIGGVLGLGVSEKNKILGFIVFVIIALVGVYIISHHIIAQKTLKVIGGISLIILGILFILIFFRK